MLKDLEKGLAVKQNLTVDRGRTIDFMGEACRVYATPSLLRDIEHTCRDLIKECVGPDKDSVGTEVALKHTAPTLLGMAVTITATVAEVEGAKVVFEVTARDPVDQICTCRHERFIVDIDRTRQRLEAKAAKAALPS